MACVASRYSVSIVQLTIANTVSSGMWSRAPGPHTQDTAGQDSRLESRCDFGNRAFASVFPMALLYRCMVNPDTSLVQGNEGTFQ